ncbi:YfcL family protein [uncultured Ferrimonas sp.]|uniref:YfcL family protein n=1 Tax=uncultured Ferrimonas sp. TaxID=432640 RepID=UPI00263543C9|nr:YfcL family protein [uncultured Ferrimonas sp.]
MLERWDQICHTWINHTLENGNDDEVFSSGYLQGHFAVVLSELEQQQQVDFPALQAQMAKSLEQAKSELAPEDMVLVTNAWQQLEQQLAAA